MNTDFAQPGTLVAVYDGHGSNATVSVHTVKRRTATQIVLDNGDKYRVSRGTRLGDDRRYQEIRPYNDPHVVDIRARQVAQTMASALIEAAKPHPQKQPFDGMDLFQVRERLDQLAAIVERARRDVGVIHTDFVNGTTPDPHTEEDED